MTSTQLAERLGVTAMAIRQHLYALQSDKLVSVEERQGNLGRPSKHWSLTEAANRFFPNASAELNIALLSAVEKTFGEAGLTQVLAARGAYLKEHYASKIDISAPVPLKLQQLVNVRNAEGYMCEMESLGSGVYLFVENHCPICIAANSCPSLCATESDLFQFLLGPSVEVERQEHIVAGSRRCAYYVKTQDS